MVLEVPLQCGNDIRGHSECAGASRGLRWSQCGRFSHWRRPCSLDVDGGMEQIHVSTLEPEHFAPAELTPAWQEQCKLVSLGRGCDCRLQFADRCDRTLRGVDLSGAFHLAWANCNHLIGDSSVEDGTEQAVGVVRSDLVLASQRHVPAPHRRGSQSAEVVPTEREGCGCPKGGCTSLGWSGGCRPDGPSTWPSNR